MLIDANVFKGFFQVEIGHTHSLCGCPKTLICSASSTLPIYHDTGKIIEHEWGNVVEREWFNEWLATQYVTGNIAIIEPIRDNGVESKITALGFPSGRDIVYVRTGLAVAKINKTCEFFTEDIDFYDPRKKGGSAPARVKAIKGASGPVAKVLRKSNLLVKCVP
ncbi:hypothetical protein KDM87_03695 [Undibacterium sp. FT147W]|uniref:Uncharacterized protein n=1 Tax=Undibacterium rivi TaxID=2828729 RepID=A0ABS5GYY8_9BURK|nr:hypothetical protein [Undibacterium rivi]MBR7791686.1 hypothetical protein [Undibacterium rivi]